MQYVSTDETVRDASVELSKSSSEYGIIASMREDVFQALKNAEKNIDKSNLSPEQKRLLEKELRDRKRAGLDLPKDKQELLMAKKKEISKLSVDFNRNCNEEKGKIEFTEEELEGVPKDVIEGFPKSEDGKRAMSFKTPDCRLVPRFH